VLCGAFRFHSTLPPLKFKSTLNRKPLAGFSAKQIGAIPQSISSLRHLSPIHGKKYSILWDKKQGVTLGFMKNDDMPGALPLERVKPA
jgi:hypothetical protein